jgi:ATP-dependent Clp endopeptidase proteolytic subunit ClpP
MPRQTWFNIARNAANPKVADISIHAEIGYWGVSAKMFMEQLRLLGDLDTINLSIHSPGGEVLDGWAIYNALKLHPAKVIVTVKGLAASMASVVMLAGDVIEMPAKAYVMIHRVSGGAWGDADDMKKAAETIAKLEDAIVAAYAERSGLDEKEIRKMMEAETWLDGKEAVAKGFADKILVAQKAKASASWADHFTAAPRALFDTITKSEPPPRTEPDTLMTAAQKTRFRALLALAKRTTEEDTELATLQALATKEGYDAAAIKADNDADTIAAMTARISTLEAQAKTAQDAADKLAKEKADADAKAKDPAALLERLNNLENLIKSGVLNHAGGTKPIAVVGEGGEEGSTSPSNQAELKEALAKAKNFSERREILNRYDAAHSAK